MLHLFLELHRTLVCNTDELATVCWTSSQQVRPRALCDRSFISTIDTGEKCRRLSSTGWPSINPNYRQIIALDQPSSRHAHISARASSWLPSRRSAVLVSCAESYRAIDVQPGAGNGLSPASSSMHETSCDDGHDEDDNDTASTSGSAGSPVIRGLSLARIRLRLLLAFLFLNDSNNVGLIVIS